MKQFTKCCFRKAFLQQQNSHLLPLLVSISAVKLVKILLKNYNEQQHVGLG